MMKEKIQMVIEVLERESERAQTGREQACLDFAAMMLEDLLAGGRQSDEKFAAWLREEYAKI